MERTRRRLLIAILLILAAAVLSFFLARALEKRTYRLAYPELITQYAGEYGIDPYLVAAVIHTESGNRPDAVSPSGAMGLMQVMPETGAWIAEKLAVSDFRAEQLHDPACNVRFGCWYLGYLEEQFTGERELVLAAYNAGPGSVSRWLEDPTLSEGGRLHTIPYGETERYVEKVQRAYEKYRTLYPKAW